jgi:hypothetical protein
MDASQTTSPGRRHTGRALDETGGIGSPGAPVLRIMTTNHHVPWDPVAGDALRYRVFLLTAGRPPRSTGAAGPGRKRLTTVGARIDAWLHAAEHGHMPATPFTLTAWAR